MGTPEFPDLGKHCSVDDCKLIDFLPFNCDRCKKVFCLQHRSYATHKCPNANQQNVTVVVCPLCAKSVRLVPNEDPNLTWDVHVNTDCDPSNYEIATKKKRCPVPGCKELLTFSNKILCRDCTQEHCLKHRFGADHKCRGPKKIDSGFPFLGLLSRSQKGASTCPNSASSSSSSEGSSWWSSSLLTAASSFKATAESGMQRLSTATNTALQKAKEGMTQSSTGSSNGGDDLVEHCLQCPAKFSSVTHLIEHVEKVHERGVTVDVCPNCSIAFPDPVLLVEHVEKEHRGSLKL